MRSRTRRPSRGPLNPSHLSSFRFLNDLVRGTAPSASHPLDAPVEHFLFLDRYIATQGEVMKAANPLGLDYVEARFVTASLAAVTHDVCLQARAKMTVSSVILPNLRASSYIWRAICFAARWDA